MSGRAGSVLVVICDLGPTYGVGHLMRCVALAEEFADRGFDIVFLADAASVPFARAQLETRHFQWRLPPADVPGHLALLEEYAADLVVIDGYHLPLSLYAAVRERFPSLAMVDGDPGGRTADVLLDQNIGAELDSWHLGGDPLRLAGLEFALMREDIRAARPPSPEHRESRPPRVFAFFGGTDAFGAGPVLARALVETAVPFDLKVVAGSSWSGELAARPGQRVEVIAPTDRLPQEVLAADLVISAAGTSSWELLCLGAACAFVCVAENQVLAYDRVVAAGAVVGLGRLPAVRQDPTQATALLGAVLADPARRRQLRTAGWQLVDGGGRERVARAALAARARRGADPV